MVEVSKKPLTIVFAEPEFRVMFPPALAPEEEEVRLPTVILLLTVESTITPPFPEPEEDTKLPAFASIAPVSEVTERVISPPLPAP